MKKQLSSSSRRWPGYLRAAGLAVLCLGLLAGGMLLPREICRWVEQQQFDRMVQLDEAKSGVAALSFFQRLDLLTVINPLSYPLNVDSSADAEVTATGDTGSRNQVQTADSAFSSVVSVLEQLSASTGLAYFDVELLSWAQSISGFDEQQGKPAPAANILLDRSTGQGAVFWFVSLFPSSMDRGCTVTLDDETGLMVQYYYYNADLQQPLYQGMVEALAGGLGKYWNMQVLECGELVNDADGSVAPYGWILFQDAQGETIFIVVEAGENFLSLNYIDPDYVFSDAPYEND